MHIFKGCIFVIICLFSLIIDGEAIKCYECRNVEGNGDDCVRLSTPCQPDEDACISHTHYTTPTAYWTPLAERKHYISKGCVSYSACIKQRDITQRSCTYDWFTDWSCVECCRGDLCNYYVTLSARQFGPALWPIALLTAAGYLLRQTGFITCVI